MIVDAHHHLWDPALADYPWMTDEVASIRRRFGPEDLEPLLGEYSVDGTIVVQARGSIDETRWLLEIADATPFVRGVVGWIDLTAPDVARVLAEFTGGQLVGIRHQVHDEPDPAWLLREDVQQGIAAVGDAGLAFDLLVRSAELPAATETVRRHPDADELAVIRKYRASELDLMRKSPDEVKKLLTIGVAPADPAVDPAQLAAMTIVTASVMNTPDAYTLR